MSQQQLRQAPWQRQERHYCATCNVWMGSDRQSIMLHENGKKHRENVERAMQERRMNKQEEEKAGKFLSDSLKKMEESALAVTGGNAGFASSNNYSNNHTIGVAIRHQPAMSSQSSNLNRYSFPPPHPTHCNPLPTAAQSHFPVVMNGVPVVGSSQADRSRAEASPYTLNTDARAKQSLPPDFSNPSQLQQERLDWQAQKIKREETNNSKRKKGKDEDGEEGTSTSNKRSKIIIRPGEGCYSYDGNSNDNAGETEKGAQANIDAASKQKNATYLEGHVFFGLLEDDMPVQLWIGPSSSGIEKQLISNIGSWRNALVIKVVNHRSKTTGVKDNELQRPTVNVSYLSSPHDTEETIEKKVPLDRIRILLGGDVKIPNIMEEARLLAMGGEEIYVSNIDDATTNNQQEIDEATGLSGWSTVTIKKTTHRQQHREERARLAENKILAAKKRETEQRRIAERRMEESRASNADDSALGAYDVYGKLNYKGVDISKEVQCSVEDTAKRLANESNGTAAGSGNTKGEIAFKKRAKKKGQRAARRRTSADDDN